MVTTQTPASPPRSPSARGSPDEEGNDDRPGDLAGHDLHRRHRAIRHPALEASRELVSGEVAGAAPDQQAGAAPEEGSEREGRDERHDEEHGGLADGEEDEREHHRGTELV